MRCLSVVPPTIANTSSDYTAVSGSSVRLVCDADGRPRPDVVWTRNGRRLSVDTDDPHYSVDDDGTLTVFSVDDRDAGTYTCTAVNVAGLREKRINLLVHGQSASQLSLSLSLSLSLFLSGVFIK